MSNIVWCSALMVIHVSYIYRWCWRGHLVLVGDLQYYFVKFFLHPSLAMVCELPLAAGLGLLSEIMAFRRFCFNIICITFGPAFAFSDFDMAGCLGFAFDVLCVTPLSFLALQSLIVLNWWHCQVLLYFFDWRWINNNPKRLKIKHV